MFKRLSVEELFGVGASQDENFLIIPVNHTKPESILAQIIYNASKIYNGSVVDESGEQIEDLVFNNEELYFFSIYLWRVSVLKGKKIYQFRLNHRNEEDQGIS